MEDIYYAYLGIVLLSLLAALIYSLPTLRQIARILSTPTTNISALPMEGAVEVTGEVEPGPTLRSPLTHADCVWWQISVEELKGTPRNAMHWEEVYGDVSTEPFDIRDGTGKIRVLPSNSKFTLNTELRRSSGLLIPMDPGVKKVLEDREIPDIGARNLQVFEWIIKPGGPIYVEGLVKYVDGIKSLTSEEDVPLIISDRSEPRLLGALYWRLVTHNLIWLMIIAAVLFLAIYAR